MATPWKRMTEEQKARKREACRRYRMKPEAKAKHRERKRRWNEKNADRKKKSAKRWYSANRERLCEKAKAWRETHKEQIRERNKAWRAQHLDYQKKRYAAIKGDDEAMADKVAALNQWRKENPEKVKEYGRRYWSNKPYEKKKQIRKARYARERLIYARDLEAYQRELQRKRDYSRRKAEKEGRVYIPRLHLRKPSWAVYGIDSYIIGRSTYVRNNHDGMRLKEFDGYARELVISRRKGSV